MNQRRRTSLTDLLNEFQEVQGEMQSRVVQYEEDGVTPLVIEFSRTDDEGTVWTTQRNLKTGETHLSHMPGDR